MSTATNPLGMTSYNNRLPNGGYRTWKGSGIFKNPLGTLAGHTRPFTNKDPTNIAPAPFGRARPIKHYRLGGMVTTGREVRSGVPAILVDRMQDAPGQFSVHNHNDGPDSHDVDECKCGPTIVSSWAPVPSLTETPEAVVTSPALCCNQEYKARRRTLPASTIVKKDYYQTQGAYLYNRCLTYEQRQFNFLTPDGPAGPMYVAQCTQSAPKGCKQVYYKPSNKQYAVQGAVSSSTRILKLNVTTIEKEAYFNRNNNGQPNPVIQSQCRPGGRPGSYNSC